MLCHMQCATPMACMLSLLLLWCKDILRSSISARKDAIFSSSCPTPPPCPPPHSPHQVVGRTKLLPPAPGAPEGSPRLPVAHMVCNQSPPVDGQPSLMTFREVETLFHEFGHALQHMMTTVDEGLVAGIR